MNKIRKKNVLCENLTEDLFNFIEKRVMSFSLSIID